MRRSNYRTHALDVTGSSGDLYEGGRYRGRGEASFDDYEGMICTSQSFTNKQLCVMVKNYI